MVDVKKINRGLILYLIYQNRGLSRKALAAKTGLTPAAITLIIGDMLREGLLVETHTVHNGNGLGRKEVILNINLHAYVALGIYIESSRAKILCCDLSNREIFQAELAAEKERPFSSFLDQVGEKISSLLERYEIKTRYRLIGAGVAFPTAGSGKEGKMISEYEKREGAIREALSRKLGVDVWEDSLISAMTSADVFLSGLAVGQNILFLKYGPTIDASYLSLTYYPQEYRSAQVCLNHFLVDPNGKACACGSRGCLCTLAGFQELAEELRTIYSAEKTPELVRLTQGHKEQVVGSRLPEFYHAADPAVRQVIEKGAFYLAMTLKNCLIMLNLSTVVVYGDLFFDPEYWDCFSRFLDVFRCREKIRLSQFRKEIETEGPAFSMVGRFFANGGFLEKAKK